MKLPPFQVVFEAERTDVYRFLLATAGPADADDCFQETWISALRAYPRLRSAENLRGWLLRIAQNKAIDAHRARGRRAVPVESLPDRVSAPAASRPHSAATTNCGMRFAPSRPSSAPASTADRCSACRTTSWPSCSIARRKRRAATCTKA